jgi:hypothetical protein
MTAGLKLEQCSPVEQPRRDSREVLIGQRVILALGRPDDLFQVQVRELWERRYRVNVYVGPDAVSARVAHSYFLETDDEGTIIKSTPTMKRQHDRPVEPPSTVPAAEAVTRV